MKRILSLLLTFVMCFSALAITGSAADDKLPFTDVKESKWFYEAVKYVYDQNYMVGITDSTFEPNSSLNRAMCVTILCRLANGTEVKTKDFSDVKNQWFAGAVGWASSVGIVNGYEDGTFKPLKAITRQEMAKMMAAYVEYTGLNLPRASTAPERFTDKKAIAGWASDYVETLRRAGIMNGDNMGKVNPKANISRAETAQMIRNLVESFTKAWQGYEPDAAADFAVLGASYLYWHGTLVCGGLGSELVEGNEYPVLSAYPDSNKAAGVPTPANSIGVSLSVFEGFDIKKAPIVKIAYSYEGAEAPETLAGQISANPTLPSLEWTAAYPPSDGEYDFEFKNGKDDGSFKTATFDLTELLKNYPNYDLNRDILDVLVLPFEEGYTGEGRFNIKYIAFFKDEAAAEDFNASDYDEYFKDYFVSCQVNLDAVPAELLDKYETELVERIDAIVNSKTEIDPAEVLARGNSCFYVSPKNGDDSNDGRTPETAWKTLNKLETESQLRHKGYETVYRTVKPGDVVFFERGSVFYCTRERASWVTGFYNYEFTSLIGLFSIPGVTYSAYGEGAKPLFTAKLDLNEGAGTWTEVADNIWSINRPEGNTEEKFLGGDVGHITFNGGEYVGVRVIPDFGVSGSVTPEESPFKEGRKTFYHGIMTGDGKNFFESGGTSCATIEEALHHNFQYFHDQYDDALYLYWDKGNPGEYFSTVEIARDGNPLYSNANHEIVSVFDNLAFGNSSGHGGRLGNNAVLQNCEIGYCGGELGSAESGIECFGSRDGVAMIGNYVHDVFDGPLSMQSTDDSEADSDIQNVTLTDNVIVACGNGFEIWNKYGPIDENGYAHHKMRNILVENNMMAYIGYGLTQRQGDRDRANPLAFCTSAMEGENCVLKDNITINSYASIGIEFFSSDTQQRGWALDGNVFVMAEGRTIYCSRRDCFNSYWPHTLAHYGFWVNVPYEERYLTYMASLGIGNTDKYYTVDLEADFETGGLKADPEKINATDGKYDLGTVEKYSECPFMTGWHVYH